MLLVFQKKQTKTDIPPIKQSKISQDESKIVSSNNNNHVTTILNTVTLNSTTIKDAGIPAKININISDKKLFNIPNKEKFNIPTNTKESLSQNNKVKIPSNKNEHKPTYSSNINVPSTKKLST